MIISEKILVKSSKFYKKIGYDISDKFIYINIKDLPTGSHFKIKAKCEYCNNEREIDYKGYNRNISINGKYSCSIKCGSLKSRETNLEKYGVEYVTKMESFKEKSKETIKEKYGVEHISQVDAIKKSKSDKMLNLSDKTSERMIEYWKNLEDSEIHRIIEKRSNTNLEKYGFNHVSQVKEFKEKSKETNIKRHGGYTFQSEDLMKKVTSTNLERYGFTNSSSSEIVRNKVKKTNLERYGFDSASKNELVKNNLIKTTTERYNAKNIMLSEDFRRKFDISKEVCYIKYNGDRNYEFSCNICNQIYKIDYDNYYKRRLRNVCCCTICFPISESSSIKEIELKDYISNIYSGDIIQSYRDGLEIDVYLPELKIGFEFNGLYWHSSEYKQKNYHLDKLNYFKDKGIRIFNIMEDDWDIKRDIIKSQISNVIGLSNVKIFARKCEIKEISNIIEYKKFLSDNHIQGFIRSSIKIGLYIYNELVSIMTFDNLEGRKRMEMNGWNLSRFCSKLGHSVIGGASKLLKYFIKKYNPSRIISFADKDWSIGNLYYKLGFTLLTESNPDYKYIVDRVRINKQRFTKKKLIKMGYELNMTESSIMESKNIKKIYNCGQLKFQLLLK